MGVDGEPNLREEGSKRQMESWRRRREGAGDGEGEKEKGQEKEQENENERRRRVGGRWGA